VSIFDETTTSALAAPTTANARAAANVSDLRTVFMEIPLWNLALLFLGQSGGLGRGIRKKNRPENKNCV
jgi:hypothetical protein